MSAGKEGKLETLAQFLASFDADVLNGWYSEDQTKDPGDRALGRYCGQMAFVAGVYSACQLIAERLKEGDPFAVHTTMEEAQELRQALKPEKIFRKRETTKDGTPAD